MLKRKILKKFSPETQTSVVFFYFGSILAHLFGHKKVEFFLGLVNAFIIVKHLLDRALPDIQFVAQTETDVGIFICASK